MPKEQNLSVPIAVIVAGALIAGALFFVARSADHKTPGTAGVVKAFVPVAADDHILGNPDAPVVVVEYTDFECPFCKEFHATMQQIMNKYGPTGQVAWVLRDFPLANLHPNAPKLAEAAECVGELGGNSVYWKFIETVFTMAPSGTFFDMSKLSATAAGTGVSEAAFNACLTGGKYKNLVSKEYSDAIAAGGTGTPYSIIVTKDGQKIPISGAQSYATVEGVIQQALGVTGTTTAAH